MIIDAADRDDLSICQFSQLQLLHTVRVCEGNDGELLASNGGPAMARELAKQVILRVDVHFDILTQVDELSHDLGVLDAVEPVEVEPDLLQRAARLECPDRVRLLREAKQRVFPHGALF